MKCTKIVATLGPSSQHAEIIEKLLQEGANVIRLNFSHGSHDDHAQSVQLVRNAARKLNRHVAIFQDLQGPKIRLGALEGEFLEVATAETLVLTTDDLVGGVHDGMKKVAIDHRSLHEDVKPGDRILIDDGLFELKVERIAGHDMFTTVVNGGRLKPHKGVNLPNIKLNISAMTAKDRRDLAFAYDHELDYVALSFVRDADDIRELIDVMLTTHGHKLPIIAKIEKPEAFQRISDIIAVSDAIMVARGDLGVETSPQDVPLMQKTIIRQCNIVGKPVITATQMLESMIANPRPTRAEANDVANAILDGTDAVMLSAETSCRRIPGRSGADDGRHRPERRSQRHLQDSDAQERADPGGIAGQRLPADRGCGPFRHNGTGRQGLRPLSGGLHQQRRQRPRSGQVPPAGAADRLQSKTGDAAQTGAGLGCSAAATGCSQHGG